MLVGAFWLRVHQYQGLVHDSRLYAIQALRVLRPDDFANDLFFAFGSQDEFTLFPAFQATFIAGIGAPWTGLLLTLVGQALWLAGAVSFFRRFVPSGMRLFCGLLALVALPPDYGMFRALQYGEGFLTARLYAEALTLFALACAPGRWKTSLMLVLGVVALHPIYGAVALSLLLLILAESDRRWLIPLAAGAVAFVGFAAAGIAPFGGLFQSMDPDWRSVAGKVDGINFPSLWNDISYVAIALDAMVVASAAAVSFRDSRRTLSLILGVALAGALTSIVGDPLDNVLITQLQPSRALWLLASLANFSLGVLAYDLLRRRGGAVALALLATGYCLQMFPYLALLFVPPGVWLTLRLLGQSTTRPPAWTRFLAASALALSGLILVVVRLFPLAQAVILSAQVHPDWVAETLSSNAPIDGLFGVVVVCLWPFVGLPSQRVLTGLASLALVLAGLDWFRTPGFDRELEAGHGLAEMRQAIPEHSLVYWHATGPAAGKGGQLVWFGLDRRPFLSIPQAAGLIFNRGTSLEYGRRLEQLESLNSDVYLTVPDKARDFLRSLPAPSTDEVKTACERAPDLGFVVVGKPLAVAPAATWTPQIPPMPASLYGEQNPDALRTRPFYLYACDDLRSDLDSSP